MNVYFIYNLLDFYFMNKISASTVFLYTFKIYSIMDL